MEQLLLPLPQQAEHAAIIWYAHRPHMRPAIPTRTACQQRTCRKAICARSAPPPFPPPPLAASGSCCDSGSSLNSKKMRW